jgi:tRNA C32,U32 (ribose-2'-O)-methylase TrmJ
LRDNLRDHAAAAVANAAGADNFLEQAVFVDELTAESVDQLHAAAARAWRQAFRTVMREAQARFDHDQAHAPAEQRVHRARFGSYFYGSDHEDTPRDTPR